MAISETQVSFHVEYLECLHLLPRGNYMTGLFSSQIQDIISFCMNIGWNAGYACAQLLWN